MRTNHYVSIILVLLFGIPLSGCVHNDGSLLGLDGNIILEPNKSKIEANRNWLLKVRGPQDVPANAEGAIILDGIVISAKEDSNGVHTARIEIVSVIYGNYNGNSINILTPSVEKGGVIFVPNRKYRIYCVPLDGAYRTWDFFGTTQLNDSIQNSAPGTVN